LRLRRHFTENATRNPAQRKFFVLEAALAVAEARLAENGDTRTLAEIAVLRLEGNVSL